MSFEGEAGLDSGGLSKEFYLLLSQQLAGYLGPPRRLTRTHTLTQERTGTGTGTRPGGRGWMVAVKGEDSEGLFFSSCQSVAPSPEDGGHEDKEDEREGEDLLGASDLSWESVKELERLPGFNEASFLRFFGRILGKVIPPL